MGEEERGVIGSILLFRQEIKNLDHYLPLMPKNEGIIVVGKSETDTFCLYSSRLDLFPKLPALFAQAVGHDEITFFLGKIVKLQGNLPVFFA